MGPPRSVLITAFEPFNGSPLNASDQVLKRLPDQIEKTPLKRLLLPTSFEGAWRVLHQSVQQTRPSLVILLGEAKGRTALSLERQATNRIRARIPDNDGVQLWDAIIIEGAVESYSTTLPLERCFWELDQARVPAELSEDAGGFVCNATLFRLLHHARTVSPITEIGFVHLPWLPEQRGEADASIPTMPVEIAMRGVVSILRACLAG